MTTNYGKYKCCIKPIATFKKRQPKVKEPSNHGGLHPDDFKFPLNPLKGN
jgi:hypothetical protein